MQHKSAGNWFSFSRICKRFYLVLTGGKKIQWIYNSGLTGFILTLQQCLTFHACNFSNDKSTVHYFHHSVHIWFFCLWLPSRFSLHCWFSAIGTYFYRYVSMLFFSNPLMIFFSLSISIQDFSCRLRTSHRSFITFFSSCFSLDLC